VSDSTVSIGAFKPQTVVKISNLRAQTAGQFIKSRAAVRSDNSKLRVTLESAGMFAIIKRCYLIRLRGQLNHIRCSITKGWYVATHTRSRPRQHQLIKSGIMPDDVLSPCRQTDPSMSVLPNNICPLITSKAPPSPPTIRAAPK
jgi:hypothetical protein